MEIIKKWEVELENQADIHLYREGGFWRAYERSAYIFSENISRYLVIKRFYKCINEHIVLIGFPDSALQNVLQGRNVVLQNEKYIRIDGFCPIDPSKFFDWKAAIELRETIKKETSKVATSTSTTAIAEGITSCNRVVGEDIVGKIRNFRLESASPIDCMLFITELKQQLYGSV